MKAIELIKELARVSAHFGDLEVEIRGLGPDHLVHASVCVSVIHVPGGVDKILVEAVPQLIGAPA